MTLLSAAKELSDSGYSRGRVGSTGDGDGNQSLGYGGVIVISNNKTKEMSGLNKVKGKISGERFIQKGIINTKIVPRAVLENITIIQKIKSQRE